MILHDGSSYRYLPTVIEVRDDTPWEANGVAGDPRFASYDLSDHDLHDGSWPDFRLTPASTNAIDKGTTALPASLATLLNAFGVADPHCGPAHDIGRYELCTYLYLPLIVRGNPTN
jgi:hypothetical protein